MIFIFLGFLRGIAMAVFIRKHNKNLNKKNKEAKILCRDKDFSFLCFLMKMPLREGMF